MFSRRVEQLQLLGLGLLAVLLPFELKTPIITLGPIVLTNVEILLYLLIMLWLFKVLWTRRLHWTLVHSAVLIGLLLQFAAALLAPVEREAALKFALRSAGGVALFFVAADSLFSSGAGRRAAWLMAATAIGAVVSAAAGLLEVQSSTAQAALLIFKTQASLVGGQLRASGTFQYANTAAMYWEAALPSLLATGVWWSIARQPRGQRRWLIFALLASLLVIAALVLSASRAAVVVTALALGLMIVADRFSRTHTGLARSGMVSLTVLAVFVGTQLIINPLFVARLHSENDDTWFRAHLQPQQSAFNMAADDLITATVTVTNTSIRPWPAEGARAVHVSYHWLQPDSGRMLILDGERTPLPRDLAPGEAATVAAFVKAPSLTGPFLLQWDMVQEDVTWFSERGSALSEVNVQVNPTRQQPSETVTAEHGQLNNTTSPARSELWRAGLQLWLSHPLLGVGPDNFRHLYGLYLGQANFDDRITANSWYVELLSTTGVLGLLAWLLLPGALLVLAWRRWSRIVPRDRILVIGLSVTLLAFFAHGVVDYFMEFTPTYGLFWLSAGLLVGLLAGEGDVVEFTGKADRV